MPKTKEITLNRGLLIGAYSVYKNAHSRYVTAIEAGWKEGALDYAREEFERAHAALLEAGLAQREAGQIRVQLPARGRVGQSHIMDLPTYRFRAGYGMGMDGLFRFEGLENGKEVLTRIDEEDVQLYEHIIELNEDGEGYCLLYDDFVVRF